MSVQGKHLLHYVPHGINSTEFKPIDKTDKKFIKFKKELFGDKHYDY